MAINKQTWSNMPTVPTIHPEIATSEILLCYQVPWNNRYEHVYMANGGKKQLVEILKGDYLVMDIKNTAPVRFGRGYVDIGENEVDMERCNYIAFRNAVDPNEWFFGFITSVEWLSPNSTRVHWEPDIWQNNIYDSVLGMCFVEREHVALDEDQPWKLYPPEDFETGEFVIQKTNLRTDWGWKYGMYSTEAISGGLLNYGNVINGLYFYTTDDIQSMYNQINSLRNEGKAEAIVSVFQYPDIINLSVSADAGQIFVYPDATIDGYAPKNNRLFSYPYVFCEVYSAYAAPQTYRFEYSNATQNGSRGMIFKLKGSPVPVPAMLIIPSLYKGYWDNIEEAITLSGFPQGAWTNDAYQAFIAQSTPYWNYQQETTQLQNRNATIQGGMGILSSLLSMNLGGAITQGVNTYLGNEMREFQTTQSIVAAKESHAMIPNSAHGNMSTPYIHAQINNNSIFYYVKTIKNSFAERIDNFFEMYGYQVNQLKVPAIHTRRFWNFVKTQGCKIRGITNTQEQSALEQIFNSGVTIWHYLPMMGSYTSDNHTAP